ncbi:uncharacterized protein A1O9_06717 [Exophiala aquamarina CBS 119918]|uniref:Cytochrome P450 oxidoreductase n=1 Tax=Exophiala aquamarina CBS 119918 TaxID=1182545 RepID=A0A072PLW0_9EURO|nr:uncharacterized protein A1O9_06717 [Exophiala aquamarina CBS 119918]KEF56530.1 hypothetical protein A1O9_06717 [Exophiala aquamarina CBS 119918]
MLAPDETLRGSPVFTVAFIIGFYYVVRLARRLIHTYRVRQNYKDIPSLPRHPLWGNLINVGEKVNPATNRHPDYGFEEVWNQLDRPSAFIMDLNPIDNVFFIIADPTVAEAIVQPSPQFKYSALKSDTLSTLNRLIGRESLIILEGEEWKNLRKRFNRGFAPTHLHSLSPLIISKTRIFVDRLKAAAKANEVFELRDYTQDLTTDIITQLTIEKDFQSQTTPEGQGHKGLLGLLTASRNLSNLVFKTGQGFNPLTFFDPIRPLKAWFYEQVFNHELTKVIKQQIETERSLGGDGAATAEEKPSTLYPKSITRLALSGLQPTPELIRNSVSQIKSFLFAGQDTTATLIQWMCFELSKSSFSVHHSAIVKKLIDEHDKVFGATADPFNALDALGREDDEGRKDAEAIIGMKLPYTVAFVRETLRLHPPAGTARRIPDMSPENPTTFTISLPESAGSTETREVMLNGLRIYICQHLIQRNPAIWGDDADVFRPERWLDEEYVAKLPTGAWRPFERGPRNCIGQELALLEAKVALCALVRGFDFHKVGYSGRKAAGIVQGDGSDDPEREIWSKHSVTSVVMDGMKMKVELKN